MSGGWWRRNAVALAAIAVLAPATALIIGGAEWWTYNSGRPVIPVTVEATEPTMFAGAEFGPATVVVDEAAADLPAGSRVLVVSVPVDAGSTGVACLRPELRELSGAQRQWSDAVFTIDWEAAERRPTSCLSDLTGGYVLTVPFLVPDDVSGRLGVDIAIGDQLPRFLRLVVDAP